MKILLIIFAIIFIIIKLWKNYIANDLIANIKYQKNGSFGLGLLIIGEYILGEVIIIKIILHFMN